MTVVYAANPQERAGMLNDTDATVLFDLDGVAVAHVHRDTEGIRVVRVVTTDQAARACPGCGVAATRVKELVTTRPRDLEHGGGQVRVQWLTRRWVCREATCARGSFTEQIPRMAAGMRTTGRLRQAAGRAVADGARTITQAGRDFGLSWPVVHREFTAYAHHVLPERPQPTKVLGVDEVRRGKPVWEQDEQTGKWRLATDRWHVGFVDVTGRQGLFGQVEGRATTVVVDWITAQNADWQASIRYVAIDMCAVFRAAVRRALPHARVVVDRFPVVQLAQRRMAELRRRCTWALRGRRGRRGDPEWEVRGLLPRNAEDLTPEQRDKLIATLCGRGHLRTLDPGRPARQGEAARPAATDLQTRPHHP
jgi:transposase